VFSLVTCLPISPHSLFAFPSLLTHSPRNFFPQHFLGIAMASPCPPWLGRHVFLSFSGSAGLDPLSAFFCWACPFFFFNAYTTSESHVLDGKLLMPCPLVFPPPHSLSSFPLSDFLHLYGDPTLTAWSSVTLCPDVFTSSLFSQWGLPTFLSESLSLACFPCPSLPSVGPQNAPYSLLCSPS